MGSTNRPGDLPNGFTPIDGWTLSRTLRAPSGTVDQAAWSGDDRLVAVSVDVHAVMVVDAGGGAKPKVIGAEGTEFTRAAWVPGTRNLAIACVRDDAEDAIPNYDDNNYWESSEPLDVPGVLMSYGEPPTSAAGEDRTDDIVTRGVIIVDVDAWAVVAELGFYAIPSPIVALAWAPGGDRVVTADQTGLQMWDGRSTGLVSWMLEGGSAAYGCAFNPAGTKIVSAHMDGMVAIWNGRTGKLLERFDGSDAGYLSCCWITDDDFAVGGSDGTVEIWSTGSSDATVHLLEGQTAGVSGLTVSPDRRALIAQAQNGVVHAWDIASWVLVAHHSEPEWSHGGVLTGAAFSCAGNMLVTTGTTGVRVWAFDTSLADRQREATTTTRYCNAKVVLAGDSGVGKSGLGLVLAGEPFRPTESTHQRNVVMINAEVVHDSGVEEKREVYLWDLAGQPGYRMVNQLQLGELAVAVVVFDAHDESNPFAGVNHWARALGQAQILREADSPAAPWLLVAARLDRGGPKVSNERVEKLMTSIGFSGYYETSAKAGWGIDELRRGILASIDWESLPQVSSTELFDAIKQFIAEERAQAGILATQDDLRRAFVRAFPEMAEPGDKELDAQFRTCIGRVAARGLVRKLSFGELVLLRPEVLDAYVSALANAARDEPDGLGSISEHAAYEGGFRMDPSDRIAEAGVEKLVRIAAIEDLLSHEIALREHSADGPYLVFPSHARREAPDRDVLPKGRVIVHFQGAVQHVYATLVVRLSHSGVFKRTRIWRNAATFESVGVTCGLYVEEQEEGHGQITLAIEDGIAADVFRQFAEFVTIHIRRKAIPETVSVREVVTCIECGCELTEAQVRAARGRGKQTVVCVVCDADISLEATPREDTVAEISAMTTSAADATRKATAKSRLRGKVAVQEFDVFLAHSSDDKQAVEALAAQLKERGINPWLDAEQIPPGRWFQDVIEQAVPNVRSAAILLGSGGLGPWQAVELRAFIAECVERTLPVIPVLLPGGRLPAELRFLRQLRFVSFRKTVSEERALDDLQWGITGSRVSI
jgi:GTPase SAR1 family protein